MIRETLLSVMTSCRSYFLSIEAIRKFEIIFANLLCSLFIIGFTVALNMGSEPLFVMLEATTDIDSRLTIWIVCIILLLGVETFWQFHVWASAFIVFKTLNIGAIIFTVSLVHLPFHYLGILWLVGFYGLSKLEYTDPVSMTLFLILIQPLLPVFLAWLEQRKRD